MSWKNSILLVEDNPDDEVLALRALRKSGFRNEVFVAHDGAEALRLLHQDEGMGHPDLILLDLKLPKLDGLEVLQRLREDLRTRHIPVVVLTTSSEEADILSSYRLGANSYLRKPVDFDEFFASIQQLGSYWFGLNELPSRCLPRDQLRK